MLKKDYQTLKKYQSILDKHNLVFCGKQFESLSGRFYSFMAKNKQSQKFWVKIIKSKTKAAAAELSQEVKTLKLVDQNLNKKTNVIKSLTFIDGQSLKKPQWLIYKFAVGKPIGDVILGYNKSFLTPKNLNKTINSFKAIHAIKPKNLKLSSRKHSWYLSEYKKYTKKIPKSFKLDKKTIKQAGDFLKQNKQTINQAELVLTHGDLFPQNILKNKNKYTIIDWGTVHLNNPAFDLATIYFNAYKNPAWQKKLLAAYPDYLIYFKAVVIKQTLMLMNIYGNIYDHPEKWKNQWPYYEKKYFLKIKPQIKKAWQAHSRSLKNLLNYKHD